MFKNTSIRKASMKKYNLVIIGFGGMGSQHYNLLENHNLINVSGICDINSDRRNEAKSTQEKTGYVFMVHQNRRWDEDFLTIKKIYETKQLGEMYHVEQRVFGSRGIPGDWRKYKEYGGGMLLDWGVHMIDRLLVMVPEKIKTVDCHLSFSLKRLAYEW